MIRKFFADKKRFTGLEIEGGYVKFAQAVDSNQGKSIVKLIIKKLPSQSEEDITVALKDILNEVKGKLGHLTISVPRNKVTVRFLRFPSLNQREIAGMVGFQSTKELPFPVEELVSDYLITEQSKDGYTRVILVIVHRDVINGYLAMLGKVGIEPERITLSTEAAFSWYRKRTGKEKLKGSSLLIDMDACNTDITIFYDSCLDFTRGLSFGSVQLQDLAGLRNKLVQEIRRTIEGYFRQEKTKMVQRIILVHANEAAEELGAFLKRELNLPCEVLRPFENLPCSKEICAVQHESEVSLVRVLGMVLETKGKRLNLLPAFLREKQELRLKRKGVRKTSGLLLGIILLAGVIFAKKIHDKQLCLAYLDREIEKTALLSGDVENMLKKIDVIESRGRIKGSSVDVLRELHNLTPVDILLSSFTYDEGNEIAVLQGFCPNMSQIFKFVNILEQSDYFKNVQLKYVSEKKAKAGSANFKIECGLEN